VQQAEQGLTLSIMHIILQQLLIIVACIFDMPTVIHPCDAVCKAHQNYIIKRLTEGKQDICSLIRDQKIANKRMPLKSYKT